MRRKTTNQKVLGIVLALFATVGFAPETWSQGGARGAIAVTVTDPSGAVIAGAQVEIINQQTGVTERNVVTAGDGRFIAPLLPVGVYRVIVSASGFAKTESGNIPVRVTETTS